MYPDEIKIQSWKEAKSVRWPERRKVAKMRSGVGLRRKPFNSRGDSKGRFKNYQSGKSLNSDGKPASENNKNVKILSRKSLVGFLFKSINREINNLFVKSLFVFQRQRQFANKLFEGKQSKPLQLCWLSQDLNPWSLEPKSKTITVRPTRSRENVLRNQEMFFLCSKK